MKMRPTRESATRLAVRHIAKSRAGKVITLVSICMLTTVLACGPTTPTPEAPPLQQAATTEAPEVEQAPTNTPTPTEAPYAEGSVVRAAYDPAAGWGPPDVHDDFSGTNPEFELDNVSGVAHGWYQNGRFNITFPTRGWWTWYSGSTEQTNFYVDVVVYNGDQCVDRDAGGLVFRLVQVGDMGFLFGVTCGGGYFSGITGGPGATGPVCQWNSSTPNIGEWDCTGMWDHPTNEYIDTGPGAANRIGVRALDGFITYYVNGHQIDSLNIPFPIPVFSGKFALYLGAGQADNASVSFDDLSIWLNP
jgi:hypothetical protein